MASLHMQNSDDYRGGKFETSASVKERTIFLWGRVRVAFALKQNLLRGRGTKILSSPYQFGYTIATLCEYCSDCIQRFFYKFLNSAFKSRASLIHLNN